MAERLFKGDASDSSMAAEVDSFKTLIQLVGSIRCVRSYTDSDPDTGGQMIVHEYEIPEGVVRQIALSQPDGSWNFKVQFPDSLASPLPPED